MTGESPGVPRSDYGNRWQIENWIVVSTGHISPGSVASSMSRAIDEKAVLGVGLIGIVAGFLIVIQVPAANQYHETTLSAAGIGVLLVLFGIKTLAEPQPTDS